MEIAYIELWETCPRSITGKCNRLLSGRLGVRVTPGTPYVYDRLVKSLFLCYY